MLALTTAKQNLASENNSEQHVAPAKGCAEVHLHMLENCSTVPFSSLVALPFPLYQTYA